MNIEELEQILIKELSDYFTGSKSNSSVDLVIRSLEVIGKIRTVNLYRDCIQLSVLNKTAYDRQELKKYVAETLPHINPDKSLLERLKKNSRKRFKK